MCKSCLSTCGARKHKRTQAGRFHSAAAHFTTYLCASPSSVILSNEVRRILLASSSSAFDAGISRPRRPHTKPIIEGIHRVHHAAQVPAVPQRDRRIKMKTNITVSAVRPQRCTVPPGLLATPSQRRHTTVHKCCPSTAPRLACCGSRAAGTTTTRQEGERDTNK